MSPASPGPLRLVLVSAGLAPEGGGTAVVGRLLADAMARWAAGRPETHLEILHLGPPLDPERVELPPVPIHACRGRLALAWALARRHAPGRRGVFVYDHLGPARLAPLLTRLLARLTPLRRPRPWAVFVHGIEAWRPLAGHRRRALEEATVLLANSRTTVERTRRHNPWLGPVEVVPLTLEEPPEPSDAPIAATGLPELPELPDPGPEAVLIVGRLAQEERYKGHDLLLDALTELLEHRPRARLVIVGDGSDRLRLEARARELGIADAVDFTGYLPRPAVAALFERATVFAMPSTGEGFGLVYLEAMAAGLPVVAARGTVAAEIVIPEPSPDGSIDGARHLGDARKTDPSQGASHLGGRGEEGPEHGARHLGDGLKTSTSQGASQGASHLGDSAGDSARHLGEGVSRATGVLVDPEDPAALAAALAALLADPERRRRLGRAGRRRLAEHFDRESFRRRVARVLDRLAAAG